jgi:hypothetical protein
MYIQIISTPGSDEPEATESEAQLSSVNLLPEAEIPESEAVAIAAPVNGWFLLFSTF